MGENTVTPRYVNASFPAIFRTITCPQEPIINLHLPPNLERRQSLLRPGFDRRRLPLPPVRASSVGFKFDRGPPRRRADQTKKLLQFMLPDQKTTGARKFILLEVVWNNSRDSWVQWDSVKWETYN